MLKSFASSPVISLLLLATAAAVVSTAGATSIKSLDTVEALCGYTAYPDSCMSILGSIASPTNTTEVIRTSSYAAYEELNNLIGRSDEIAKAASGPRNQLAIQSCKNFLGYAVDDIRAVIMEAHNLHTMSFDLRNWMSGVIASAAICIEELDVAPDLQSQMKGFMGNATELMSNALSLITGLAEVVEGTGRKLGECPAWMPARDRKLLASGNNAGAKPDVTVAWDGSGDVKTIMEAIGRVPKKSPDRFTIYVKAGTYKENVTVPKEAQNVFMYGDGQKLTKVTGSGNVKLANFTTSTSATFSVLGNGFICKGMWFENTAGPHGHQAVALRVHADRCAFFNCRMDGYQDTLYTQRGLQFYRSCHIAGTVDFIFGMGAAVLQECTIVARKPLPGQFNAITADGRTFPKMNTGIVLHGCRIVADKALFPERFAIRTYLGRPWKPEARTVVMESLIGDLIRPEGWLRWNETQSVEDTIYAEYNNDGPGAVTDGRVDWAKKHLITDPNVARQYTVDMFLEGSAWVLATGARVTAGLMK